MSAVFLDTVGLIARWDRHDQWHVDAKHAFASLLQKRTRLLTTTFVLLECGNAAARRPYRTAVDRLRTSMEAKGSVIVPSPDDWIGAWQLYRDGEGDAAGIVDCISFVVMRRLGLTEAFTNDQHFRAAGFQTLF